MPAPAQIPEKIETSRKSTCQKAGTWTSLIFLLAFLTAFLACIAHNFVFCESRIMLASDGKHYLHTVSLLVEYFKSGVFSAHAAQFLKDSDLAAHLIFDGPLISFFFTPVFLILDKIPTARDWTSLAVGQSFLHGTSTLLLSALVLRLTRSKLFAAIAILAYGLYPTAILQTGHFMAELALNLTMLTIVFCLSRQENERFAFAGYFLCGLCSCLIALSKPALIPAVLIAGLFGIATASADSDNKALSERKYISRIPFAAFIARRQKVLCALFLGFSAVILPWCTFSYKACGSFMPTAQRQPVFNVVTGWNLESNGWAQTPPNALTQLYDGSDGTLGTAAGIWISHPQESLRLALSKVGRMLAYPWNDFKGRALGLDHNAQILVHRIILACACFGIFMFMFCAHRSNKEQRRIMGLALILIISHAAYLMVEGQPRYFFSAVPFLVLCALYGIWQASNLTYDDPRRKVFIVSSLCLGLGTSALLLNIEQICQNFDPFALKESCHELAYNDSIEKTIDLAGARIIPEPKAVILMVDGDKELEKANLEINGQRIKGKLQPLLNFDWQHYQLYDQLREFAPAMRISVSDFRQWRGVEVDPGLINWHGENKFSILCKTKSATIYGDISPTRRILSPDFCNYGYLAAAAQSAGAEIRISQPVLTAQCAETSAICKASAASKQTSDSLRIRLLVKNAFPSEQASDTKNSAAEAKVQKLAISRNSFDQMLWDNKSNDRLQINKTVLYSARTVAADIILPQLPGPGSHLNLSIKGKVKALKNPGEVGILAALKGENGRVQILGRAPRAIQANDKWQDFEISDLVPLDGLGGRAAALELALYPCPWMEGQYGVSRRACDALFEKIEVELSSSDLPSLAGRRFIY